MARLSECEELVMAAIWKIQESGETRINMQRITKECFENFGKEWKTQTVSTFLARLCEKGFLSMKRSGRTFFYTPLIEKNDYFSKSVQYLRDLFEIA